MGEVKSFKAKPKPINLDSMQVWECGGCGSQIFILLSDGNIVCFDCEHWCENLKTTDRVVDP